MRRRLLAIGRDSSRQRPFRKEFGGRRTRTPPGRLITAVAGNIHTRVIEGQAAGRTVAFASGSGFMLTLYIAATAIVFDEPRFIDLADNRARQTVIEREPGHYLGHPTTVLLEDGRTIVIVYPKGHGRGAIVMKRSTDGGRTWSDRLPTPANWTTSLETPTIHRVVDSSGKKRLILFSGLHPI